MCVCVCVLLVFQMQCTLFVGKSIEFNIDDSPICMIKVSMSHGNAKALVTFTINKTHIHIDYSYSEFYPLSIPCIFFFLHGNETDSIHI